MHAYRGGKLVKKAIEGGYKGEDTVQKSPNKREARKGTGHSEKWSGD